MEEFLQLVHDAEYVVSNSFHGVAFSLIFQKQFFAVGMGERANRVLSLLENVGATERYVTDGNSLYALEMAVEYERIESKMETIIKCSKDFLTKAIEE